MKKQSGPLEKDITKAIRQYLKMRRVYHWKQWQGLGSTPGVADILGIYQGRMLAIEVKGPKGRVSEKQQEFIDTVNECGGIAFVARSVDDVIRGIEG